MGVHEGIVIGKLRREGRSLLTLGRKMGSWYRKGHFKFHVHPEVKLTNSEHAA